MTSPQVYALDANVFIEAARRYYAFDLAPSFWRHLERLASEGHICSIDAVKEELEEGKDQLADWAKTSNFKDAFTSTDEDDVVQAYREIILWVQNNTQFFDAAKQKFADDPDGWLIAYAMAKGCIAVTQEGYHAGAKSRIPIPNVCRQFSIPYVDTFAMLRALGVTIG